MKTTTRYFVATGSGQTGDYHERPAQTIRDARRIAQDHGAGRIYLSTTDPYSRSRGLPLLVEEFGLTS